MNRLLIVVAAGLLGTGCVSHDTCDVRTVHVRWDSFQLADGSKSNSCSTASVRFDPLVDSVDVFLDGQPVAANVFPCTWYGVDIDGVGSGSHELIVEGLDVHKSIVLRDWVAFTASDSCGDLRVDTQPAEGFVDVAYDFYSGSQLANPNACTANSVIAFSITDTVASTPAYPDGSSVSCSDTRASLIPLAYGSYQLNWLQEVQGSTVQSSACTVRAPFDVNPGATTNLGPVALDIAGPACH